MPYFEATKGSVKDKIKWPDGLKVLKDTVGFTGKNKLYDSTVVTKEQNGVTFTVNSDWSVVLSGTATGYAALIYNTKLKPDRYIITGLSGTTNVEWTISALYKNGVAVSGFTTIVPADGSVVDLSSYDFDTAEIRIVRSSNAAVSGTAYPMLRDPSITDSTYEPYHEPVEVVFEEEIHGVNLLHNYTANPAYNKTVTIDTDGTIHISGPETTTSGFNIVYTKAENYLKVGSDIKVKKYLFSCKGSTNNVFGRINILDKDLNILAFSTTNNGDKTFDLSIYPNAKYIGFTVWHGSSTGTATENITLKPMLVDYDLGITDFTPYNPQSIQHQLNAQTGMLGAKNVGIGKFTSLASDAVVFTVDDNNVVNVNGTNSNPVGGAHCVSSSWTLKKGDYILSMGSKSAHTWLVLRNASNNAAIAQIQAGEGEKGFSISADTIVKYDIAVEIGGSETNYKVYSMVRVNTDPDDTYAPPTMTNRELTENTLDLIDNVFRNQRLLTTSDDLNNTNLSQGVYLSQGVEVANKPSDITGWWHLIYIKTEGFHQQFIIAGTTIYIRYRGGSPVAWSPWRKFTSTVVS